MTKIWRVARFVAVFVLAIHLIEYQAPNFLVEFAGDLFGAVALMFVAIGETLND